MISFFDEKEILKSYIKSERYKAAQEAKQKKAKKIAIHLIKLGKISLEDIAETTELPLDIIKELKVEIMQLV